MVRLEQINEPEQTTHRKPEEPTSSPAGTKSEHTAGSGYFHSPVFA